MLGIELRQASTEVLRSRSIGCRGTAASPSMGEPHTASGPSATATRRILPCQLGRVVNPSRKILALEEDSRAINDGTWWGLDHDYFIGSRVWPTALSVRHDGDGREFDTWGGTIEEQRLAESRRGNVVFADGHGEFFPRRMTIYGFSTDPHIYDDPTQTGPREP